MAPWKIFYDDGSTFSSDEGQPHDAPTEGFVCALGYNESGARYIMHGWDFYRFDRESDQWWGMNVYGLHDCLRRNNVYAYKEGRTLTDKRFQEIMRNAHTDPDFPQGVGK